MEKPTFIAIDYNSYENKVIEERVRDYYQEVKALVEIIITQRLRNPNIPHGLCADFIEKDRNLWRLTIKPWFTPQRFNLTNVYFGYSTPLIQALKEEVLDINGRVWFRVPLEKVIKHEGMLGIAWFPVSKDYNAERLKILECALEDLERIKKEGEPKLPPITEDEPIIY
nr:MAG: hypothetical protein [Bacteriophage sp.]